MSSIVNAFDDPASGVTAYMCLEHKSLDRQILEVERLVDAAELTQAARTFALFSLELERRMAMEEEIVYPVFEACMRLDGATRLLRDEHVGIRAAVRGVAEALDARERALSRQQLEALLSLLEPHLDKEERVLFPSADRGLGARTRRALARKLAEFVLRN